MVVCRKYEKGIGLCVQFLFIFYLLNILADFTHYVKGEENNISRTLKVKIGVGDPSNEKSK